MVGGNSSKQEYKKLRKAVTEGDITLAFREK